MNSEKKVCNRCGSLACLLQSPKFCRHKRMLRVIPVNEPKVKVSAEERARKLKEVTGSGSN